MAATYAQLGVITTQPDFQWRVCCYRLAYHLRALLRTNGRSFSKRGNNETISTW